MTNPHCRIGRVRPRDGRLVLFPGVKAIDAPVNRQPHQPTIALLRSLLDMAERGDINGVAATWMRHDGYTASDWRCGGDHLVSTVAGGIMIMFADYMLAALRHVDRRPAPPDAA